MILALSALFLSAHPPRWVLGLAAGAGAAVPAVAVSAAIQLIPASWQRAGSGRAVKVRWFAYLVAGGVSAATTGALLVLVLVACGAVEIAVRTGGDGRPHRRRTAIFPATALPVAMGGIASLCWVAVKVGALSYGGGFVIIPLMQHDAVVTYHWMTGAQFLNAVALGQVTPGPVVQTVAVVGYAAGGLWGGILASVVAFAPSFVFVIAGASAFRPTARRSTDPVVLHRSGSGGDRCHRRIGDPPRIGTCPCVAVGGPGRGRRLAAGPAPGRRTRARRGGGDRPGRRARRRARLTMIRRPPEWRPWRSVTGTLHWSPGTGTTVARAPRGIAGCRRRCS